MISSLAFIMYLPSYLLFSLFINIYSLKYI